MKSFYLGVRERKIGLKKFFIFFESAFLEIDKLILMINIILILRI